MNSESTEKTKLYNKRTYKYLYRSTYKYFIKFHNFELIQTKL